MPPRHRRRRRPPPLNEAVIGSNPGQGRKDSKGHFIWTLFPDTKSLQDHLLPYVLLLPSFAFPSFPLSTTLPVAHALPIHVSYL